jgi:hypothetical protein
MEAWRVYNVADARAFLTEGGVDVDAMAPQVEGKFASAFIRATKPAAKELLRAGVLRLTTVLFACVHNAGRSQMAAGFFNALGRPGEGARDIRRHAAGGSRQPRRRPGDA